MGRPKKLSHQIDRFLGRWMGEGAPTHSFEFTHNFTASKFATRSKVNSIEHITQQFLYYKQ